MAEAIVTVQGEASQTVAPDRAGLSVTIHGSGASAEAVRAELASASGRVRAALDGRPGVVSFVTQGLHVGPVFTGRNAKITGYRGTFGTSIEVDDFDGLPELLRALTALPTAEVVGPWWSLSTDHPAHRLVRLAAVADARSRAEDYAAAFGARLGPVLEVSDGGGSGFPHRMAFAKGMAEDAPALDLEPADQTVSGQVTVRFALLDVAD